MARYIDADALYEKLYPLDLVDKRLYTINAKAVADAIANMPTADVVPKSEVDELAEELSDLIEEKDCLFDEVVSLRKALDEYEETSGLKQAKSEVAREIFEDIQRNLPNDFPFLGMAVVVCLDELKKKYTGEEKQ